MRITAIVLLAGCLSASAIGFTQKVSLNLKDAPVPKLFKEISRQTGMSMLVDEKVANLPPVTIKVKDATVTEVLNKLLPGMQLEYSFQGNSILIRNKVLTVDQGIKVISIPPPIDVRGRVVNENGEPVRATVTVKGTKNAVSTNDNGEFLLKGVDENATLIISGVGLETFEVRVGGRSDLAILTSKTAVKALDETIVQAYGTTTRRLNTGNIGKVSSEEIGKQSITNPLAGLEGRVPGMDITQLNGNSIGAFKVQIRGVTSVGTTSSQIPVSNDPLFIIDGVPYAPNNTSQSNISSVYSLTLGEGGISPFAVLNPGDIESIEVLKDADATAIYGSRGANGVVLITTKKGKSGKTQVNFNMNTGVRKFSSDVEFLNTSQFLQIRRQAFQNDNKPVTGNEFLLFDTSRYTNYVDEFIGAAAHFSNYSATLTGGNAANQFLTGFGYQRDATVYPEKNPSKKITFNGNFTHKSPNKKLNVLFGANYGYLKAGLALGDLTNQSYRILPNHPAFLSPAGKLIWEYNGYSYASNPYSSLYQDYNPSVENLNANLGFDYSICNWLKTKFSGGYNFYQLREEMVIPKAAINPSSTAFNSIEISQTLNKSWIVEPQLEFHKTFKNLTVQSLLGGSWQKNNKLTENQTGSNFISDDLLHYLAAAGQRTTLNNRSEYKYQAFFGRLNLNWGNKYLLNITGRRDGSSRFGPNKRFSNFGAIGAGWIFSNNNIFKNIPWLSFGKLRVSYGSTGNDKIGDYQYIDSWSVIQGYQGATGFSPTALFNPDYSWERNKKFEAAVELGMFKDRVILSAVFYKNVSDNQLINYKLPSQTGFTGIIENFPAVVQNRGLEFEINSTNFKSKKITWKSAFTFSVNKGKLKAFPGIENSSYASSLIVGESLTLLRGYHLIGVDPATGVYTFQDLNKDSVLNSKDWMVFGDKAPAFFGGLNNIITYSRFQLSFFFSFKKQKAANYLATFPIPARGSYVPPTYILNNYWQKPGDIKKLQRLTQDPNSAAFKAANTQLPLSDGVYSDASYFRLKNIHLSYTLSPLILNKIKTQQLSIFLQADNLLTFTKYEGFDPATLSFSTLPSLKSISFGISITF